MRTACMVAGLALSLGSVVRAADKVDVRTVAAEGAAVIVHEDRAGARTSALDQALQRAVEQVVDTLASPEVLAVHAREVEESIENRFREYVQSYRVVSESADEEKVEVRVEAEIDQASLKRDLQSLQVLPVVSEVPRAAVFLQEGEKPWWQGGRPGPGQPILSTRLTEAGIDLVGATESSPEAPTLATSAVVPDPLRWAAQRGADFVVLGEALQEPIPGIEGSTLRVARAKVSLRAVATGSGKVLAQEAATATAVTLDPAASRPPALDRALGEAGDRLAQDLLGQWARANTAASAVEVRVGEVSNPEVLREVDHLLRDLVRGSRSLNLRSFDHRRFVFELKLKGGGPALVRELKRLGPPAPFRMVSADPSTVSLTASPP